LDFFSTKSHFLKSKRPILFYLKNIRVTILNFGNITQ
jgi:hypothetical protein